MALEFVPGIPVLKPFEDLDNQPFWQAVKRHELVIQKCGECGMLLHPPRPMCPNCLSTERKWIPASGRGTVYSRVNVVYDKVGAPFLKVPHTVVLVELEEGVRVISNTVDVDPKDVYIGMPVEVVFTDLPNGASLYHFKKCQE